MPFNFWFVHTPPGGHIDGISGDCDLNKQRKVKWFNVSLWSSCPTLPYMGVGNKHDNYITKANAQQNVNYYNLMIT